MLKLNVHEKTLSLHRARERASVRPSASPPDMDVSSCASELSCENILIKYSLNVKQRQNNVEIYAMNGDAITNKKGK